MTAIDRDDQARDWAVYDDDWDKPLVWNVTKADALEHLAMLLAKGCENVHVAKRTGAGQ